MEWYSRSGRKIVKQVIELNGNNVDNFVFYKCLVVKLKNIFKHAESCQHYRLSAYLIIEDFTAANYLFIFVQVSIHS